MMFNLLIIVGGLIVLGLVVTGIILLASQKS